MPDVRSLRADGATRPRAVSSFRMTKAREKVIVAAAGKLELMVWLLLPAGQLLPSGRKLG